jgi:hypothetical protein
MDSKHGGSDASGLVPPVGIDGLEKVSPDSPLFKPAGARTREQAQQRARDFERRRIALELMAACLLSVSPEVDPAKTVGDFLVFADELIRQTGGHVVGEAQS